MRYYVDLNLDPRPLRGGNLEEMIEVALSLKYSTLGVRLHSESNSEGPRLIQTLSREYGVDLVSRLDLFPRTRRQLLGDLKRYRNDYDVIAVRAASRHLVRIAANDGRVDLLSGFPKILGSALNHSTAKLLGSTDVVLEINSSDLLVCKGRERVDLLSQFMRGLSLAQRFHVKIILSSGATDAYLLRSPSDQVAIGHLLGMRLPDAFDAVSKVPLSIIERDREILDPDQISKGVRLVDREEVE